MALREETPHTMEGRLHERWTWREVAEWMAGLTEMPEPAKETCGLLLGIPRKWFDLPPVEEVDMSIFDLHHRGTATRCCRWCGDLADVLCDYIMSDGETCDRECCREHATEVGPDRHHCPEHV